MSVGEFPDHALLSAAELELLDLLIAEEGIEYSEQAQPIPARRSSEASPLSFAQERLWLLDQLAPGNPTYNIPFAARLRGSLDEVALALSLEEIVRRHESLRTTFTTRRSVPVQVIAEPPASPLLVVDLERLPAAERRTEALRLGSGEARRPFDLERGPLLRAVLARHGEGQRSLHLTMHHIVADGWSIGIFVRELSTLYAAFTAGRSPSLPELPIQHADYSCWQRERLRGEVAEELLAYWRERLAGAPEVMDLPVDRPRPVASDFRGARRIAVLEAVLVGKLETLSRSRGATLFTTLLAAFQVLLMRCTGQDDVVVGSPIANRNRAEIEPMIGFFVNILVLRGDLSGDPSFLELLDRIREVTEGAYAHQDLPFEKLVAELGPTRDLSRSPLFQVFFMLQNAPEPVRELAPGLALELGEAATETAKFDLTLGLGDGPDGFRGELEYDTDLFDSATIGRFWRSYETLLEAAVAGPERRLSELAVLGRPEIHQLLREWNDTAAFPATEGLIHKFFEARAAAMPEALAVVAGGHCLSYRELDERAARLAHRLRALGVRPDLLAGICVGRSPAMVVGILGVLKAGGAYVPLDPEYPKQRLAFTLDDAGARVLLTERRWLGMLPEHRAEVVFLDEELPAAGPCPPWPPPSSRNLAYVIYTSGSTGQAKGVAIEHHSTAALICWAQREFAPAELAGVLASTSICFDLSVFEIFVPLAAGGTVIVAGNALDLPVLEAADSVSLVNTVPSVLRELLRLGGLAPSVRTINLAGEALPRALAESAYALPHVRRVLNLYGPSEDTTYSTWARVAEDGAAAPPIGRPLRQTRTYLLDQRFRPLPIGVPGELYLAGEGLARCYLGRPRRSAERWLPDPWTEDAVGGRLYRTGDRVRQLAHGTLDFLGRLDHQVKIRGFRIELGEVEASLNRHPGVREAAVVARADGPSGGDSGDLALVAYVVCREQSGEPGIAALREHLGESLPRYMVPAAWVFLEALPLMPNGKVDRRALPMPAPAAGAPAQDHAAPRTPTEELLAGLWSELLCRDRAQARRFGIDDNFFELGGHSLLATQAISRLRADLGIDLPLRAFFKAPTVRALAERLDEMASSAAAPPFPSLVPVPRDGDLPLSFAQKRLWFLAQLHPEDPSYHLPTAFRLRGPLSVPAFERAFGEVVRRHEALRTSFAGRPDGEAVQIIDPQLCLRVAQVDLGRLTPELRETQLRRLAHEEARRLFDLSTGPLLRVRLLRLEAQEHTVLVTLHHIVADGWSLAVLFREMETLYAAFAAAEIPALPELPVQYADFAHWQWQWLRDETAERLLSYWRQRLAGAPQALELPADRPRPAVSDFRGDFRTAVLTRGLSGDLKALSRSRKATLFQTLLAAFVALLRRYTGQEDIVLGSPIANRNRLELEGLIGFFVNTLVLRTDLSGDPSFSELASRVRNVTEEAYEHQDLPFEMLVEELAPERDLSRSPLFQVMFVLQNTLPATPALPGLEVVPFAVHADAAKFDWTVTVIEADEGFQVPVEYRTELFDAATVLRLLRHYSTLLEGLVGDPEQRLSELPLLHPAERQQLLRDWNDTAADDPPDLLHELFEARARRHPETVAVLAGDQQLTYGALSFRANQLAHRLRQLGVETEIPVGLFMERSPAMVVGLLGVLKAGGSYVPLDPSQPRERVAYMLRDSRAAVLLSQVSMREQLADLAGEVSARLVCLDDPAEGIAGRSGADPVCPAAPGNLAYVIYTSGSTGRPKGVQICHRSLVNFLRSMRRRPGLESDDRLLAVTTLSFDIAGLELYLPLTTGARVELVDRLAAADGRALRTRLRESGATLLQATPATWRLLLDSGWDGNGALKILCGGEALPPDLAVALRRRSALVWNLYGPTETTIWSTVHRIPSSGPATLGRPLDNTGVFLCSPSLKPLPIGVPGELCLGGDGLARGYLYRGGLTAEKFVPHPWSARPGERLYKTGDLVRHLVSGELEFLGRRDHQVKLRGFRIELGEIETALTGHPAVRAAVVLAREDAPGATRLVAYVVARTHGRISTAELGGYLRTKLPDYMQPAAFVELEALPLTPNGKLDRRALPKPHASRDERFFVTPRTPLEELLAGIWQEVLGVGEVGRDDDFFKLGGHSLLAAQLISRLRRALAVEVPLRLLFQTPTLAGLAASLEAAGTAPDAPPIEPTPRRGELPLSFAQQRIWIIDRMAGGSPFYNQPAAVEILGELDTAALAETFREIVRRHEALRTSFAIRAGRPVQIIRPVRVSLPVIDLEALAPSGREQQVRRLALAEARRAFDLSHDDLLRLGLLRLTNDRHVLLFTLHHIAGDGWSAGVLLSEMAALYEAFAARRPSPLRELPVQYADFAVWQRRRMRGEVLEAHLDYWRRQLGGHLPAVRLPTDHPRPAVPSYRGARRIFLLPADLDRDLRALARREGVTLFMLLLAAFKTLLYRDLGQEDLVVGAAFAGRDRFEVEGLVGCFVNLLPLRTSLAGNPGFRELLRRVREVCLGAYKHQDLPLEKLSSELGWASGRRGKPMTQVAFGVQNTPWRLPEPAGHTFSLLDFDFGMARFELTLWITERADGLDAAWTYASDLFAASTIDALHGRFETLLRHVAAAPQARLNALEIESAEDRRRKSVREQQWQEMKSRRFLNAGRRSARRGRAMPAEKLERRDGSVSQQRPRKPAFGESGPTRRRTVRLSQEELVKSRYLEPGESPPLVVEPNVENVNLSHWATLHREWIESRLVREGALLFRGFGIDSVDGFEAFISATSGGALDYTERSSPRSQVSGRIYTSTDYPADREIFLHNEQSYNLAFPQKIYFCCLVPAEQGGETPIADSRRVFERLAPRIRRRFMEEGYLYVRNFGDGFGLPWQNAFQTEDRAAVEAYCRQNAIELEWKGDDRLRTRQVRPAVARHPSSRQLTWFNHATFFHVSTLEPVVRDKILEQFAEGDLPNNTYYGDGSVIEPEVMEQLHALYREESRRFEWRRGDILMLDNMLMAHAREPFTGARKVVVGMAEPLAWESVLPAGLPAPWKQQRKGATAS